MFHTKTVQATLEDINTTPKGLTTQEVQIRQKHFGKNILPQGRQATLLQIFLQQFTNPIIYVLIIAAVVSVAIKEFSDAGFIVAVLLINAVIGTYQEYQANKSAQALKKMIKTYVYVLRDGKKREIPSEDVTVGDILFLNRESKCLRMSD